MQDGTAQQNTDELERKNPPWAGAINAVPTTTLYQGKAHIHVNTADVPEYKKKGWKTEPPDNEPTASTEPTNVPTESLSVNELRKRATAAGYERATVDGMKKSELVELLARQSE